MNTAAQAAPAEQVTMSVKLMESLLKLEADAAFERGAIEGMNRVTSLSLNDDCGVNSAVHILHAKTRRALSAEIKTRNYRRDGDNPGQAFLWTCKLLRAFRNQDGSWQGVCVSSVYYDV